MAGWISSKLKVAESFLQQIDQQAAESLGKNDRPPSPPPLNDGDAAALRKKADPLPVKFQLPKKPPPDRVRTRDGGPRPPAVPNSSVNQPGKAPSSSDAAGASASSAAPVAAMDGDWTTLLSSPKPISPAGSLTGGSSPSPRSSRKAANSNRRSNNRPGRDVEIVPSGRDEGADSGVGRQSGEGTVLSEASIGALDPANSVKGGSLFWESPGDVQVVANEPSKEVSETSHLGNHGELGSSDVSRGNDSMSKEDVDTGEEVGGLKDGAERSDVEGMGQSVVALRSSPPRLLTRFSSKSSGSSGSDSDSTSTSDSEYESERKMERRKRGERMLAEKAAAIAAEAIKERENLVARLEGEKESLEKVLEERQKQQAQEASELQTSMMEAMEAVELEKQKHNSTRMEAFARLAELETKNAELARSLATAQWDLEVEVNQLVDLRELIQAKELAQEELRRRISNVHQNTFSSNHTEASKGSEYESKMLEAEYSFVCDKIVQLKEKAKSLERNIEMTKELVHPTEVEIELEKRLGQLTDHLIQKQAQVEALSSEKATLQFRIETITRLLEENGMSLQMGSTSINPGVSSTESLRVDIEAGTEELSYSTLRPGVKEKINSRRQQLGSFIRQLDAIFAAGAMFLRKNPMAQLWSMVYLMCLHMWVIYILMSHSQTSDVTSSGAVFSLESINKSSSS